MKPALTIHLPRPPAIVYPIFIRSDIMQHVSTWLPKSTTINKIVIITDHTVKKLYADKLFTVLKQYGYSVLLLAISSGEKSKNHLTKHRLQERMLRQHCGRDTLCIALGGGVVGDLTGFLAATFMRGIPFIQMPTTLLAMVDSSVGGKTSINAAHGKNLIGAFWQPQAVVADIHCLKTLPKQQLINGLIEAIKVFLTNDRSSFLYTQKNLSAILSGNEKALQKIVQRAVAIKAAVVEKDEKETNLRMVLNFGHTVGHAIEHLSHYKILHGFAVALGILVEAKISQLLGLISSKDFKSIAAIFAQLGIQTKPLKKFTAKQLLSAMQSDKKTAAGKVRYVLLKKIGQVYDSEGKYAHPVANDVVKQALLELV